MYYLLLFQVWLIPMVLALPSFTLLSKLGKTLNVQLDADETYFESESPNNNNYSPYELECPQSPLLRTADRLSIEEQSYISNRSLRTSEAVTKLLKRLNIPGFNISSYVFEEAPTIALAISGGGYRSMLTAGGVISAFDDRIVNSTHQGHLGGILQSSSYIAGVSGGSWLVSSLALHDYLPITSIKKYWKINEPLLEGVPNFDVTRQISDSKTEKMALKTTLKRELKDVTLSDLLKQILSTEDEEPAGVLKTKDILKYYKDLHLDVRPKKRNGFSLSFTDYWGRAIAKRIFPEFAKSPGVTLSDLVRITSFKNYLQPFPILVANVQDPGREFDHFNSQIFEFNPFETGCWDNVLNRFMKIKYLGTELFNGTPTNIKDGKRMCVAGFDNLGFITGTSSSLFNNVIIYIWQYAVSSKWETYQAIKSILATFGLNLDKLDNTQKVVHSDYALYSPNPFHGLKLETAQFLENLINSSSLFLADGGEDGENIPFQPLIQKYRKIDIIFAVDSTSDYNNWPNGTTINLTKERYHSGNSSYCYKSYMSNDYYKYSFPHVPTPKEIVGKKLNQKPFWLGCHLDDYPDLQEPDDITTTKQHQKRKYYLPPLIAYLPNSYQSYFSNTSTFKLTYDDVEVNKMIENGYNIATYQNSTIDRYYSQCVGCAILKRDFDRHTIKDNKFKIPKFCEKCYSRYCWS